MSSESVALVVESKLGSGYGDDQLGKYLTWLDTEFADRQFRGLVTLTAAQTRGPRRTPSSLPTEGSAHRHACGRNCTRRLLPRSATGLPAQLVGEFLEMLTNENLVPMQPLTGNELQTAWSESWRVISRYRDFFHACKERSPRRSMARRRTNRTVAKGSGRTMRLRAVDDIWSSACTSATSTRRRRDTSAPAHRSCGWQRRSSVRASRRRTRNSPRTRRAAGTRGLPGGASDRTYGAR